MSRVGKKPIEVPGGVNIEIGEGVVKVEGPKGRLEAHFPPGIVFQLSDGILQAERDNEDKQTMAFHGLARSLVANAVAGVTTGFSKQLDVVGIGYRAEVRGGYLNMSLGFSHPVEFPIPDGIEVKVERAQRQVSNYVATITISGIDRQKVGQIAADIRAIRPPDSYKGKGVRYAHETIKLKVGKKGA